MRQWPQTLGASLVLFPRRLLWVCMLVVMSRCFCNFVNHSYPSSKWAQVSVHLTLIYTTSEIMCRSPLLYSLWPIQCRQCKWHYFSDSALVRPRECPSTYNHSLPRGTGSGADAGAWMLQGNTEQELRLVSPSRGKPLRKRRF